MISSRMSRNLEKNILQKISKSKVPFRREVTKQRSSCIPLECMKCTKKYEEKNENNLSYDPKTEMKQFIIGLQIIIKLSNVIGP